VVDVAAVVVAADAGSLLKGSFIAWDSPESHAPAIGGANPLDVN
jgi:hypothetical protein